MRPNTSACCPTMSLGNRIHTAQPQSSLTTVNYPTIYIADFTERTKHMPVASRRHVEITASQQNEPFGATLMDSLNIYNSKNFDVEIILFDDNVYNSAITTRAHANQHCEGTFSILDKEPSRWIAIMELKDCDPHSRFKSEHAFKAKRQIYNVVQDLRARGIITTEHLYGLISWPQVKTSFNSMITGADVIAATRYKKFTGVTYYGANEAYIVSREVLQPVVV